MKKRDSKKIRVLKYMDRMEEAMQKWAHDDISDKLLASMIFTGIFLVLDEYR